MFTKLDINESYTLPPGTYYLWDIEYAMFYTYWNEFINSYQKYRNPVGPRFISYDINKEQGLIVTCNTFDGVWCFSWIVYSWQSAWNFNISVHSSSIWMFMADSVVAINNIYWYINQTGDWVFITINEYWIFDYDKENGLYSIYDGSELIAQIDTWYNWFFD